jgi:hypothetical protein
MRYKSDGGVISSSVPSSPIFGSEHNKMFGLYRGQVIRVIYPDSPESYQKKRIEYVVKVNGQEYPNAISMKQLGGIFQQQETVYKGVEKSLTGEINIAQYPENLDGEMVYVMFIEGHGNIPLIVGHAEHPRADKAFKEEDGRFDYKQFNGVEFMIDKDSNYIIKQSGNKDPEGQVTNEAGKDAFVKMSGNGDIELSSYGPEGEEPDALRMKFTKEAKKMEFFAQENKVVYDESGVSIIDKNNNEFKFTSGGVELKSVDKFGVDASGDVDVKAGGKAGITAGGDLEMKADGSAKFEGTGGTDVGSASSPTNVNGQAVNLAGGGAPVAKLGSKAIGTGNLGAPVICTIIEGSTKVTTA